MAIITLTTDFGIQDEYVGVLKGVILSTAPDATIVDVTHGIEAQDIASAAQVLKASYTYFPQGTIHMAVVDPGVGTERAIIAAQCDGYLFLAPNNGLLAPILSDGVSATVHRVDNEILFLHPVSRTFHGRDIFAPVAAHLAMGVPLSSVGPQMDKDQILALEAFEQPPSTQILPQSAPQKRDQLEGRVTAVDRFGNLITNLHTNDLAKLDGGRITFTAGIYTIEGLVESYAQIDTEDPVAIIGSRDCVEIAINFGNASHTMNLGKGDIVKVRSYPEY